MGHTFECRGDICIFSEDTVLICPFIFLLNYEKLNSHFSQKLYEMMFDFQQYVTGLIVANF